MGQFLDNFKHDEAGAVEDEELLWAGRVQLGVIRYGFHLLVLR